MQTNVKNVILNAMEFNASGSPRETTPRVYGTFVVYSPSSLSRICLLTCYSSNEINILSSKTTVFMCFLSIQSRRNTPILHVEYTINHGVLKLTCQTQWSMTVTA